MGIEHHLVDKERVYVPICATKIREDVFKHWDFIPDNVKQYFVKKVVLLGTESSGKSTVCDKLGKYFETNWVKEYGRFYTETVKEDLDIYDFYNITNSQKVWVESEIQIANKLLFCDTEAITTKIFSELYCPEDYKKAEEFFDKEIKEQKYHLYILLDPSTTFVQDGNRRFKEKRLAHYQMIKKELDKYGIKYHEVLGKDYDDRFNITLDLIKKELKKAPFLV
jgi:HTH-type transcriptional repressor of NAD biosynthesis genes